MKRNSLYVMVYYAEPPVNELIDAISSELESYPGLRNTLLTDANRIVLAPTQPLAIGAFVTFEAEIKAHRGNQLTRAEANYLVGLAQATLEATGFKAPHPPPPCKPNCV